MDVSQELRDEHQVVASLLSGRLARVPGPGGQADRAVLADLRLDQVIAKVARGQDEHDLIARLLGQPVCDIDTLRYRHEVFRDLEDPGLFQAAGQFAAQIRQVRGHLAQLAGMRSGHQREGWFLDAAAIYCDAVRAIAADLEARAVGSRGLTAFRDYLAGYVGSAAFQRLAADTAGPPGRPGRRHLPGPHQGPAGGGEPARRRARLQRGDRADLRAVPAGRGQGLPGAVPDLARHESCRRADPGAGRAPVQRRVRRAGRVLPRHARFTRPGDGQFDRELQFYLAYLDYIRPLRAAGLSFCYPDLSTGSKEIFARDTFDLALAASSPPAGQTVVTNEFHLTGRERVIVVSGPNQGGKTTFARTFGQLHHLAGTGCPVPGSAARLFVPDQIFTHFEREEDLDDLAGKLEDDLLRIQKALLAATPDSVVIMNEIFTSTTASDARFLGEKVLAKVIELDLLCVYVTFIDELASLGPTVVSMTSTIAPDNPAERTFKVVRKPADGLAYALAIARKHDVTYEQLKGRLAVKAHLLYPDQDFDFAADLPPSSGDLIQDLELSPILSAMAGGDKFLHEISTRVLLTSLTDPRRSATASTSSPTASPQPDTVRRMYAIAVGALEDKRKTWGFWPAQQPAGILSGAVGQLEVLIARLGNCARWPTTTPAGSPPPG